MKKSVTGRVMDLSCTETIRLYYFHLQCIVYFLVGFKSVRTPKVDPVQARIHANPIHKTGCLDGGRVLEMEWLISVQVVQGHKLASLQILDRNRHIYFCFGNCVLHLEPNSYIHSTQKR